MRYSLNNYVGAFTEALKVTSQDKAKEGLVKLLSKTGDIRHSGKILSAIQKKLVHDKGGKWVSIETARELSTANVTSLKHKFSEKDHVEIQINPELVAGVRVTINGEEELNNSLQSKLNKLFK